MRLSTWISFISVPVCQRQNLSLELICPRSELTLVEDYRFLASSRIQSLVLFSHSSRVRQFATAGCQAPLSFTVCGSLLKFVSIKLVRLGLPRWLSGKESAYQCGRRSRCVIPLNYLSREDPLEEEMATCYSILAWKIPQTEEPGCNLSPWGSRAGHDWTTKHAWIGDAILPSHSLPPLLLPLDFPSIRVFLMSWLCIRWLKELQVQQPAFRSIFRVDFF